MYSDAARYILKNMSNVLGHHFIFLRHFTDQGELTINDEEHNAGELDVLWDISQNLQEMGEDLERLIEEGLLNDESV